MKPSGISQKARMQGVIPNHGLFELFVIHLNQWSYLHFTRHLKTLTDFSLILKYVPLSVDKCDRIWENWTFCKFHQNSDFALFSIYNFRFSSLLIMSIYNCTVSELQRFLVQPFYIANIESGKLACAHTQNRTLNLYFPIISFHDSHGFIPVFLYNSPLLSQKTSLQTFSIKF